MADKDFDDDDDILKEIDNMDLDDKQKSEKPKTASVDALDDDEDIDLDDDDFDLGEIDDDLGDEAWDDFDDEDDESEKAAKKNSDDVERSLPPPKKSKLGNVIVLGGILVLLAGGGYVYLGMQQQATAPRAPQPEQTASTPVPEDLPDTQDIAQITPTPLPSETDPLQAADGSDALPSLSDTADLPPMPTTISSETQEEDFPFDLSDLADSDNQPVEGEIPVIDLEDDTLTPMPSDDALAASDEIPDFTEPQEVLAEQEPVTPDFAFEDGTLELPEPDMPAVEPLPVEQETLGIPELGNLDLPAEEPEFPVETLTDVEIPQPEIVEAELTPEPAISPEPSVDPELVANNEALETENASLRGKVEELDGVVSNLNETIESLRAEIAALEKQAMAAPAAPKATVSAPKKDPKPAAMATSAPRAKAPEASTSWVLRSAQPGKAVISAVGSNDLRTVETGDTVAGLGKIQTIDIINGKWVVKGSTSSVSR